MSYVVLLSSGIITVKDYWKTQILSKFLTSSPSTCTTESQQQL